MKFRNNFSLNFKGKTEFTINDDKIQALRLENGYRSDYDLETVFNLSDINIKRDSFIRVVKEREEEEGGKQGGKPLEELVNVANLQNRFGISFELKYNMTNFWDNTLRIDEISLWYLEQKIKFWLK